MKKRRRIRDSKAYQALALRVRFLTTLLSVAVGFWIVLALFEPRLEYRIENAPQASLDSEEFSRMLEGLSDAKIHRGSRIEVLTNGPTFYEAELAAIGQAQRSINLEAYIFQKGEVTRRFLEALNERARAGVRISVVLDAVGSFATWQRCFADLREGGGRVAWYQPIRWNTWPRLNYRTHRNLLIVDGQVAFTGGAGFADHWLLGEKKGPRWRDTMFRVEGDAVAGLQGSFVENWLEAAGEVLTGPAYFPLPNTDGHTAALVINSSPTRGRSTRGRIVFQTLLATAKKNIDVTTPYFLPDGSARQEIVRAIQRGVDVKIIVPGKHADHLLTRRSSRRLYGELLKVGVQVYEYQPAMIHTKTLIVDGDWSVFGTTNFDQRSFGINEEINVAAFDAVLATRLLEDFRRDLAESRPISYAEWQRRPFRERFYEWFGWILERQQ